MYYLPPCAASGLAAPDIMTKMAIGTIYIHCNKTYLDIKLH